jgi:metal-responsive CopG/Arc/MetJ family transcriptional regulator
VRRRIPLKVEKKSGDTRTTVNMPRQMIEEMAQQMEQAGLSSRQRSTWVCDAVRELLDRQDMADLVGEEFIQRGTCETVGLTIPAQLDSDINTRIDEMVSQGALVRDRSSFVRTAITQKIIGGEGWHL